MVVDIARDEAILISLVRILAPSHGASPQGWWWLGQLGMACADEYDDYDDYDDYGEVHVPAFDPPANYSPQQPAYGGPPPAQAQYSPPPGGNYGSSYTPPAGTSSYGVSYSGGGSSGGLSTMSSMSSALPPAPAPAASKYGGGDKCHRCGKTVYFAEAREGPNNLKYHKSCFTCLACNKVLDSTFSERQGDVYCKVCYGKEFGPKGFGFGAAIQCTPDSTPSPEKRLSVTNPSPPVQKTWGSAGSGASNGGSGSVGAPKAAPRFGGGDICGRCGKTVYFAEAREGPNNVKYHKSCFSCLLCNKTLDSHFAERKGKLRVACGLHSLHRRAQTCAYACMPTARHPTLQATSIASPATAENSDRLASALGCRCLLPSAMPKT